MHATSPFGDDDLVFIQSGSMTDASNLGSMTHLPERPTKADSRGWELWEKIAKGDRSLVIPPRSTPRSQNRIELPLPSPAVINAQRIAFRTQIEQAGGGNFEIIGNQLPALARV